MSDYILYHNPRWGKSKEAVSLLNQNNINYIMIEYLKNPLSVTEVTSLSKKLGLNPGELVRKSEKDFKDKNLDRIIADNYKMAIYMSKYPKIMERPILVKGNKE